MVERMTRPPRSLRRRRVPARREDHRQRHGRHPQRLRPDAPHHRAGLAQHRRPPRRRARRPRRLPPSLRQGLAAGQGRRPRQAVEVREAGRDVVRPQAGYAVVLQHPRSTPSTAAASVATASAPISSTASTAPSRRTPTCATFLLDDVRAEGRRARRLRPRTLRPQLARLQRHASSISRRRTAGAGTSSIASRTRSRRRPSASSPAPPSPKR